MMNLAGWFGCGAAMGWLGVLSQQWTVLQLEPGQKAVVALWFLLGMLLRWIAAAALLFFAVRFGLFAALAAAGGLFIARWLALVFYTRRI